MDVSLPELAADPLAGLGELLPLETSVSLPHRALPPVSQPLSALEQSKARLYQEIANELAPLRETVHVVMPRKAAVLTRWGRTILYLLVLLAALTPMVTDGLSGPWVEARPGVASLSKAVDALPPDAVVLLSYDYSPAYAGELDPLALAVVRHLADRSIRSVAMSICPEGVGLADRVYATVSSETPSYQYGDQYLLLGYLPGEQAGLRLLSQGLLEAFKGDYARQQPLDTWGVTADLTTIQDFSHIIVLSDDGRLMRYWIEQISSRNTVMLDALVAARIEPLLVPYLRAGQLNSVIGAAHGAGEYEASRGLRAGLAQTTDAHVALVLIIIGMAVATNVVHFRQRKA